MNGGDRPERCGVWDSVHVWGKRRRGDAREGSMVMEDTEGKMLREVRRVW